MGFERQRRTLTLVVAATGYGLLYWTWTLVGPVGLALAYRYGLTPGAWALLGVVPVAVGALVCVPAGVLADRSGAGAVLAVVSTAAGAGVLLLAAVDSPAGLVVVAAVLGIAGGAFPAGAAAVVRSAPAGRRGPALSTFAAGLCLAAAAAIASRVVLSVDRAHGLVALAVGLLGYALLAAAVLRDRPATRPERAAATLAAIVRIPATRHLAAWYGLSCGGVVTLDVYLPSYLHRTYDLAWPQSSLGAAAAVVLGAAATPIGGWMCGRRSPIAVLAAGYATVGALLLVLAFRPPLAWAGIPALAGVAAGFGVTVGAVLALLGRTAPPERAGAITGVVGAAGGAAGLLPSLLLTAVYGIDGSYTIGLMILAGASLAAVAGLRARRTWIGAAAAFPVPVPPVPHAATTVVALSAPHLRPYPGDVAAALAALATRHELAIVYADRGPAPYALVAGLRRHLPAHTILAIAADTPPHPHEARTIAELLASGALPVVLVTGADPTPTALAVAEHCSADQVLHLTPDHLEGLVPHQRRPAVGLTERD